MIEIFKYYAKCNMAINTQMIRIMEEAPFNVYDFEVDGYYKNIGEILSHCYIGDMSWLSSFRTIKEYTIYKNPLFNVIPKFGEKPFNTTVEFKAGRAALDNIIIELADEINTDDLYRVVSRITRTGVKLEKEFWKAFMHMFNHQTHHRGQVSQILDQLKIQNDYSNMILID